MGIRRLSVPPNYQGDDNNIRRSLDVDNNNQESHQDANPLTKIMFCCCCCCASVVSCIMLYSLIAKG